MTFPAQASAWLLYQNINRLLARTLPCYLLLIAVTTVAGAYGSYLYHDPWSIGDWLINYQGGMVRRGLSGEIIYSLTRLTGINPGMIAVLFQVLFFWGFLFFSLRLLRRQPSLLPYGLLIFSPFIFPFQIYDTGVGYRKEVIYLAVLSFIIWFGATRKPKDFERTFVITLLLYPALILSHEMFAVFLPYLLIVYCTVIPAATSRIIKTAGLIVPSVLAFVVCFYFRGTGGQVAAIFHSLARENYILINDGSISWLDKSAHYAVQMNLIYNVKYAGSYLLATLLAVVAFIPVRDNCRVLFRNKTAFFLLLAGLFGSVPLMIVALDWGRIIYIHLVSLFLLSLLPISPMTTDAAGAGQKKVHILSIVFFFLYSMCWHIPHSCAPLQYAANWRQVNLFFFIHPYSKIHTFSNEVK